VTEFPIVPGGISCQEVVELVTAYLEAALPAEQMEQMQEHLLHCAACLEYVEQIRMTARIAAVATVELELRPDRDALLHAFEEFRHSH
jgi:predicted anti-sigma-YlaC factor YlaD